MSTNSYWAIALGVGLVVELVAVALLHLFLKQVQRIERGAQAVWAMAQLVARNMSTTWMLGTTSERLDRLTAEALRHDALLRTGSSAPKGG